MLIACTLLHFLLVAHRLSCLNSKPDQEFAYTVVFFEILLDRVDATRQQNLSILQKLLWARNTRAGRVHIAASHCF